MTKRLKTLLGLSLFLLPSMVFAHTGVSSTSGFLHGFLHPLGGADHLLAMFAVGLWAVMLGGNARWIVPSSFIGVMIVGGILGFTGVPLPFVEGGILLSVLIMGLLLTGAFQLPVALGATIVGVFALFHGHAHGAEMPHAVSAVSYAVGFALATGIIHLAGIGAGTLIKKADKLQMFRITGAAITLGGVALFFI